jgi:hypothetical protein
MNRLRRLVSNRNFIKYCFNSVVFLGASLLASLHFYGCGIIALLTVLYCSTTFGLLTTALLETDDE